MKSLKNIDLQGKRVLLRLDLNLPMLDGKIIDQTRLIKSIPTINYLIAHSAKVIIISHLGRPEGKNNQEFSLNAIFPSLKEVLPGVNIIFKNDCIGKEVIEAVEALQAGQVLLLENLRFYAEEERGDIEFANQLASLADIYVNDAFACSHRAHASITAIAKLLPAYPGLLMQEEVNNLELVVKNEQKQVMAIVGGKKVSTKFKVLQYLAKNTNNLVVAGAMANTFVKAEGMEIGQSYYEEDFIEYAKTFMRADRRASLIIPNDFVTLNQTTQQISLRAVTELQEDDTIYDVGIKTIEQIENLLKDTQILLWNGPLGFYEDDRFSISTLQLARIIAERTQRGLLKSIIGGGDTIAAVEKAGLTSAMTYVSTGGGALLEYLEQGSLPGIEALY